MSEDDARTKQDGRAIFAALTSFEEMPEREQPEQQERDWSLWDGSDEALARAYADAAEEMRQDPPLDMDVSHGLEPEDSPWT
ncbi:hypothetical protein [Deinococcus koreensis]|uniref:Uncharacterized protein n=1 Tax=Deinococcus koreensis TaxID=2054903 RepID=A0A2K3UWT9_9DEIO|nr:hypothetical protein [Deinococcus koreensis]PNY81006.1 hypothetical protein CVO96_06115 [Deinococcus koreensis]